MKKKFAILFSIILLNCTAIAATELTAEQILSESDNIRNPSKPFAVTLTLTEYHNAEPGDKMTITVHSKEHHETGQYRSLVQFIEPLRDRDKLMLQNGSEIWFYDPASSNSIRLSPQQRLLGQASNGDVMSTNFAIDYSVTLIGEEVIKDAEKKERNAVHLKMAAKRPSATYEAIDYWVDKTTYQPIKAKFYASSGKLMKIGYYLNYKQNLGELRPSETLIIDGIDSKKVTRMEMNNYRFVDIPEAWLQSSYLPRFKGQ
jgi:outer membrane lipoprotein-sorting protein